MIITIDGPVASGKSSVARSLAKKLDFYYLGTGSLYRGLAYLLMHYVSDHEDYLRNPNSQDLKTYLDPNRFVYLYDHVHGEKILFDGQDITPFLKKNSKMDAAASILSTSKLARDALLDVQRSYGKQFDLVTEGRDAGSVVFPNADVKIFLTASLEVRAQRWRADQKKQGNHFSLKNSMDIISTRDERDQKREVAPLVKPSGAIVIDNSDIGREETLEVLVSIAIAARVLVKKF